MYLGDFPVNGKVFLLWNTNDQTGASITRSTDGTLKVYKGNLTAATWITERTSLAGVTQTEDFDGGTGVHAVAIDLSDNTDAGFYAAGNEYQVVMTAMTIDTKVVNAVIGHFSIERANGILAILKSATFGLSALKTLIDTLDDFVDTEVAAIKAKTDNLPPDPADQSLIIAATDAIIADTNDIQARLPAALSAAGNIKSDIKEVNDIIVTGDGQPGTEWGP